MLEKARSEKSRDYRDVIVYEKPRFQIVFRPYENTASVFSNYTQFGERFWKAAFSRRLVWTVGLSVEAKLRFQIIWLSVNPDSRAKGMLF